MGNRYTRQNRNKRKMNAILVPITLKIDLDEMIKITPLTLNPDTVRYSNALIIPIDTLQAAQIEFLKASGAKDADFQTRTLSIWSESGNLSSLDAHELIEAQNLNYVCAISSEEVKPGYLVITYYSVPKEGLEYEG
jgi:hypothetical protein